MIDEEREINKNAGPAIGEALEGQRSSIMDPNLTVAPTASEPMAGFKGIDGNDNNDPV